MERFGDLDSMVCTQAGRGRTSGARCKRRASSISKIHVSSSVMGTAGPLKQGR